MSVCALPRVGSVLCLPVFPIAMCTNGMRIVTLTSVAVYVDPGYLYAYLHHGGSLFSPISVALLFAPFLQDLCGRQLTPEPVPGISPLGTIHGLPQ
jgi:hypothetical protein